MRTLARCACRKRPDDHKELVEELIKARKLPAGDKVPGRASANRNRGANWCGRASERAMLYGGCRRGTP
jgi:hypothetical protein